MHIVREKGMEENVVKRKCMLRAKRNRREVHEKRAIYPNAKSHVYLSIKTPSCMKLLTQYAYRAARHNQRTSSHHQIL